MRVLLVYVLYLIRSHASNTNNFEYFWYTINGHPDLSPYKYEFACGIDEYIAVVGTAQNSRSEYFNTPWDRLWVQRMFIQCYNPRFDPSYQPLNSYGQSPPFTSVFENGQYIPRDDLYYGFETHAPAAIPQIYGYADQFSLDFDGLPEPRHKMSQRPYEYGILGFWFAFEEAGLRFFICKESNPSTWTNSGFYIGYYSYEGHKVECSLYRKANGLILYLPIDSPVQHQSLTCTSVPCGYGDKNINLCYCPEGSTKTVKSNGIFCEGGSIPRLYYSLHLLYPEASFTRKHANSKTFSTFVSDSFEFRCALGEYITTWGADVEHNIDRIEVVCFNPLVDPASWNMFQFESIWHSAAPFTTIFSKGWEKPLNYYNMKYIRLAKGMSNVNRVNSLALDLTQIHVNNMDSGPGTIGLRLTYPSSSSEEKLVSISVQAAHSSTYVTPMLVGIDRTTQSSDSIHVLSCEQNQKITGIYGIAPRNGGVTKLGIICGNVPCGYGDVTPNHCSCYLGQEKVVSGPNYICSDCQAGKYAPYPNLLQCIQCPGGYTNNDGTQIYTGTNYATSIGLTAASDCSYTCKVGYSFNSQTQACSPCFMGEYKTTADNSVCLRCQPGTYSTITGRSTPCDNCGTSTFNSNFGRSTCTACSVLTARYGFYIQPCTRMMDSTAIACSACPPGQGKDLCTLGNNWATDPPCQNCNPGTYQPVTQSSSCQICATGKYTSLSGSKSCIDCPSLKALNGQFIVALNKEQAATANCPVSCNGGYFMSGLVCAKCPANTWSNPGLTVCSQCTPPPSNGRFITPISFNSSFDGCPWDCNAGYERVDKVCQSCVPGKYAATTKLKESDPIQSCQTCVSCVNQYTYESSPCIPSKNRVCSACRASCPEHFYKSKCSILNNSQCIPCKTNCTPGFYIFGRCNGIGEVDVSTCVRCTDPSTCVDGTFMEYSLCNGLSRQNTVCKLCTDRVCSSELFEKPCTKYSDSICLPYTSCASGNYLKGSSMFSDGSCSPCTNCSVSGLKGLANCTNRRDTLCGGVGCSPNNPCSSRRFCDFSLNKESFNGTCGRCPNGYSSDGLFCLPCPRLSTCNNDGTIACLGEIMPPQIPTCQRGLSILLRTCLVPTNINAIPSRGGINNALDSDCVPYLACNSGFYLKYYATGSVSCEGCTNVVPQYHRFASRGLSDNDETSCLVECDKVWNETDESCKAASGVALVNNKEGFYDPEYNDPIPCPTGKTSKPGAAINISQCVTCPLIPYTTGDPCRGWVCVSGWEKRGEICVNPLSCYIDGGYNLDSDGSCFRSAPPWQPPGFEKIGVKSNLVNIKPPMDNLTYYSKNYGISKRHTLKWLNQTKFVPGQVCSAVIYNNYIILCFCNAPWVAYLKTSGNTTRRLIGSNSEGYVEGFKDTAMFKSELYVATFSNSIFISDRLNCVIRTIHIPNLPGDYTVRSYLLLGSPNQLCYGPGTIAYPGRLWTIPIIGFVLFITKDSLYSIDAKTRTIDVICDKNLVPYNTTSITTVNGSDLILSNASISVQLQSVHSPCPDRLTSKTGGKCVVDCDLTFNFVSSNGMCVPCSSITCGVGFEVVPCSPRIDTHCQPCPTLEKYQDKYSKIYHTPNNCDKTFFIPPCPPGMYSGTLGQLLICLDCPRFSTTLSDAATSVDQCRCVEGVTLVNNTCSVGQIYPLPTVQSCPFGKYPRGFAEQCSSCRTAPFMKCDPGKYTTMDGDCLPCSCPNNATLTSQGTSVGNPRSCLFECNNGFYRVSGASFLSSCQPCTNAPLNQASRYFPTSNGQTNAPRGCLWDCLAPHKLLLGECVPCETKNPIHPSLPCIMPQSSVESTGQTTLYSKNGTKYRSILFNTSGYLMLQYANQADILVIGWGGKGGDFVGSSAGGGGGSGQVSIAFKVTIPATINVPITIGSQLTSASFMGISALPGGAGGTGLDNSGSQGGLGASGGGSGSPGTSAIPRSQGYSGGKGGLGLGNYLGGGGGGSGPNTCRDGKDAPGCNSGGCGQSIDNFLPYNFTVAQGGDGGGPDPTCLSMKNSPGSGGNGGSQNISAGAGNPGIIIVLFIDEDCACI